MEDFQKVEMRVGVITSVRDFPRARKPAWRVEVDFGPELGTRRSSMQAKNYGKDELPGMQVIAVTNFPPKNIAGFMSEVLILGVDGTDGEISLLTPSREALPGARVY
ncbi:MAG: tRNA-binding protein [Candidatus Brocadiia bacterium]